ncbi:hypothetical protein BK649_10520 [Pseudomonas canadensis]|uniref:Uncharacterized protein n=1 Tax=Pseudomonas canadensis TaxID=915099 RepID=A0A423FBS0_9PSED|nr:hypothetical protein BK649_10520 [Pseudomonas canadensis]
MRKTKFTQELFTPKKMPSCRLPNMEVRNYREAYFLQLQVLVSFVQKKRTNWALKKLYISILIQALQPSTYCQQERINPSLSFFAAQ